MIVALSLVLAFSFGIVGWALFGGWRWGLFFFLLNAIAPFVAAIGSLALIGYMKWYGGRKKRFYHTQPLDRTFYFFSFPKIVRRFGEGSVKEFLHNEGISLQKRLMALNLIAEHIDKENIANIKHLLHSKEDELRLYAFSILDRVEKEIFDKIRLYRQKEGEEAKYALLQLYFEIVELGLVEDVVQEHYEKVMEELAQELMGGRFAQDAKRILSKLYVSKGEFEKAQPYLGQKVAA